MILESKHTEKHMGKNLEVVLVEEEKRCKLNPYCNDCSQCFWRGVCSDFKNMVQSIKDLEAATAEATLSPSIISMSGFIPTVIGPPNKYLSEVIDSDMIKKLQIGNSMVINGPTGCGKSRMIADYIEEKPPDEKVMIIVPRRCIKRQLRREVAKELGIPPDKAEEFLEWKNVYILTYQSFINRQNQFKGKLLTVFLDECHCLSSDAAFAMYPQQMLQWLENNLDTTKRIYITATIDNVLPLIWSKEYIEYDAPPTSKDILDASPEEIAMFDFTKYTRIQQLVLMKANWDYLNFKFYDPSDTQKLADYINDISKSGKKTLMLLNDIDKGSKFNQLLAPPARQIYSDSVDDALNEEISKITENSMFEGSVLITTKVANIGLSLHDSAIEVIVAESFEPEEIIQIIGRVRVDRRKPRPVTVLLPDYSSGDLGRMEHMLIEQLNDFKAANENPYTYRYNKEPYSVPSRIPKKLIPNDLAIKTLDMKLKFIQKLKVEEQDHQHSFINHILPYYGKGSYDDTLRIDYDAIIECKSLIQEAAKVFDESDHSPAALDKLRVDFRAAFNATGTDFKRGKSKKAFDLSTNFQINTINEILAYGEVGWSLKQGYIKCDKEPIE
jgi:superfamily II DNA or RNA helicase